MTLLDRFRRLRVRQAHRRTVGALERIAAALEEQNRLLAAAHPEAAARLKGADPEIDSSIAYPDTALTLVAQRTRERIHASTGRLLDDEALMAYLQTEDDLDAQLAAAQVELGRG